MIRLLILILILHLFGCGSSSFNETLQSNDQANPIAPTPSATPTATPSVSPTPTPTRNPAMLIANRGDGTVSVVDTTTDSVIDTINLPTAANPSSPSYVVVSPTRIYVGDDANSRVSVFSVTDFSHQTDLSTISDSFHMWLNTTQLWVVDRPSDSLIVFDLNTNTRLAVVPIPNDLSMLGGTPHDVVIDATHAYVTVAEVSGVPDVLVKYDLVTFQEVARANVGEDPHVILSPINRRIYVACQLTNNVFVLDRDSMAQETVIPVLGGHGVWIPPDGQDLYVTNFPSHVVGGGPGPGAFGLFGIDLTNNAVEAQLVLPTTGPHNLASTQSGNKLYLTHSNGGTSLSVFDISATDGVPVFLRTVTVGTNPFGIAFLP